MDTGSVEYKEAVEAGARELHRDLWDLLGDSVARGVSVRPVLEDIRKKIDRFCAANGFEDVFARVFGKMMCKTLDGLCKIREMQVKLGKARLELENARSRVSDLEEAQYLRQRLRQLREAEADAF